MTEQTIEGPAGLETHKIEEREIVIKNQNVELCLKPNGDILIDQELVENSKEVVEGMRRLITPQNHLIHRLGVLAHRIKNVSDRKPMTPEEGYKMVNEFADEMIRILEKL